MGRRHLARGVQCPFREKCPRCRPEGVRIVKERRTVFSSDLRRELRVGRGDGAVNKALRFLHHTEKDKQGNEKDVFGCERHIEAWRKVEERRTENESNVMYFGEKGDRSKNRLFFMKPVRLGLIRSEIQKRLNHVQKWLLSSFEKQCFGTYYLSSFETRKLAPFPEGHVSNSLGRLLDIGFLKEVTWDISKIHKPYKKPEIIPIKEISNEQKIRAYKAKKRLDELLAAALHEPSSEYKLDFLTTPKLKKTLENSRHTAVLEELVQYEVVKQAHMRLLQTYSNSVVRCAVRKPDPILSKLTKGFNFDIFCDFTNGKKRGADVFTRFPLSEAAVRLFARKAKTVDCIGRIYTCESLSDKVDRLCKECRISLIYLENTSINYRKIRQEIESKLSEAGL